MSSCVVNGNVFSFVPFDTILTCLLVVVLIKFAVTLLAQSVSIVSTDQTSASMMQCQNIAVPTTTQGPGGGHARNILQMDLHLLPPRGAHGMLAGRMPSI